MRILIAYSGDEVDVHGLDIGGRFSGLTDAFEIAGEPRPAIVIQTLYHGALSVISLSQPGAHVDPQRI